MRLWRIHWGLLPLLCTVFLPQEGEFSHLERDLLLRPNKKPEVSKIFQNPTYFFPSPAPETSVAVLHCWNWNEALRYTSGVKIKTFSQFQGGGKSVRWRDNIYFLYRGRCWFLALLELNWNLVSKTLHQYFFSLSFFCFKRHAGLETSFCIK